MEKFLESKFSAIGDFPWESETDYEVFRCQNGKWFALLMKIPISKLGIKSEEKVYVVNLKSNSVASVIDKRTIFPAWHMNKKYWITVLLSPVIDFDLLCDLTLASYKLVSGK